MHRRIFYWFNWRKQKPIN